MIKLTRTRQTRLLHGLHGVAWVKDDSTNTKRKFYGKTEAEALAKAVVLADKWRAKAEAKGEQIVDRFYVATPGDGWSALYLDAARRTGAAGS